MRPPAAFRVTAVLVALSGFAAAALARQTTLHLSLTKGDVRHVSIVLNQSIDVTVRGVLRETTQELNLGCTITVRDVDPQGDVTAAVRFDSVSFRAETPTGNVEYDSKNPDQLTQPPAAALAALVGQEYTMKIGSDGRIISTAGSEKIGSAVAGKLSAPDEVRLTGERILRRQFQPGSLTGALQNLFAPLPDRPVAIGDTWGGARKIDSGFPYNLDTRWKLSADDGAIATIEVSGTASTPPAAVLQMGPSHLDYELHGELHGRLQIQESTGQVWLGETNLSLAGRATYHGIMVPPETVPITIRSRLKVETK